MNVSTKSVIWPIDSFSVVSSPSPQPPFTPICPCGSGGSKFGRILTHPLVLRGPAHNHDKLLISRSSLRTVRIRRISGQPVRNVRLVGRITVGSNGYCGSGGGLECGCCGSCGRCSRGQQFKSGVFGWCHRLLRLHPGVTISPTNTNLHKKLDHFYWY